MIENPHPKSHCYCCGKEVSEYDVIEGPDLPICADCFTEWNTRCYELLETMKEEKS